MSRSQKIAKKTPPRRPARQEPVRKEPVRKELARKQLGRTGLGALPEWNLADLYSGLDDPAVKRDLDRADAECVAFEQAYKGKLADMARSATAGAALADAVRRYEAIDDLMGRLASYSGLL